MSPLRSLLLLTLALGGPVAATPATAPRAVDAASAPHAADAAPVVAPRGVDAAPAPFSGSTDAAPTGLSLPDAERLFLSRGLDLQIAQATARAAEGDLRAAQAHPNPSLQISPQITPALGHDLFYRVGTNVPTTLWGIGVSVSDNAALFDQLTGKRGLRIETATRATEAARRDAEDVRRSALAQLRQAYVTAVMARLNLTAAQESLDSYDQALKLNQARYQKGAINGLDLSRVQQAELEAQQAVDQARAGVAQTRAALFTLLAMPVAAAEPELITPIDFRPVPEVEGATLEGLVRQALERRPDVKAAQARADQAEAAVRQARRSRAPDVAVSLGYSEQCSAQSCSSEPAFTLGLQGTLPVLYQAQGEIARAEANAVVAQRTLEKVRGQVAQDVAQSWAAYQAARSQVERMNGGLLAQARKSRDLAQLMYQKGAASLLDFLDAQRAYVASELEAHQDLASYWAAVFQLEQASGFGLQP